MNVKLSISLEQFLPEAAEIISQGRAILKSPTVYTEQGYKQFLDSADSWLEKLHTWFTQIFVDADNPLVEELNAADYVPFQPSGVPPNYTSLMHSQIETMEAKLSLLEQYKRTFPAYDLLTNPENVDLLERKNWDEDQKQLFILQSLQKLRGDSMDSIEDLFTYNGLEPSYTYEIREICKELADQGFIEWLPYGGGLNQARLLPAGNRYLKQLAGSMKQNDEAAEKPTKSEIEQMRQRIDDLIEELNKKSGDNQNVMNGLEIVFNELQELKELFPSMKKKNWGEIVLGKLGTMVMDKVLDTETIQELYQKLTGHELKSLLSG